ncbi:Glycosylated integral ER membrane protein [Sarracenia purpurea var. burkii]
MMWIECLVGDLHGDLAKARCALEMVGSLSSDGRDLWTGGETVLIQVGDILDRCDDEIAILSLLHYLDIQAKATGEAVFQINGNHETMNVEGDFRYVDSGAFDECLEFLEHLNDCEQNCPMPIFKLILEIEKVLFLPDN